MTTEERRKQIDEHFKTLTIEQFEENMEKAGVDIIKPSNCEMLVKD